MLGQTTNVMLAKAEEGIQQKVAPKMQPVLAKVVHAGLTIMYSPKLKAARDKHLAEAQDPAKDAGQGAARLISNLYQQSHKTMPPDVIVPAAMILAFEYLDLVSKVKQIEITPDLLAGATKAVGDAVLPLMGVTPEKLQQMIAAGQQKQGGAPAQAMPPPAQGIIGNAQAGA